MVMFILKLNRIKAKKAKYGHVHIFRLRQYKKCTHKCYCECILLVVIFDIFWS